MRRIKALLVGVSRYLNGCVNLPLCINDIKAMKSALVNGLDVRNEDIILCGDTGFVLKESLTTKLTAICSDMTTDDTFIFYFSGHGGYNCLALSIENIDLQDLINSLENIPSKNKVIILDSCHSGGFSVSSSAEFNIEETVEKFAGHGYAVMASCSADGVSGFDKKRQMSLYTRFVCDALCLKSIIRRGKKSLEEINQLVFRFAEISNKSGKNNIQKPIFRSNIGGTIFFDIEQYTPYTASTVYEETDRYIIYDVQPIHHGIMKRFSVTVILRSQYSIEEIAEVAKEIRDKLSHCEVFNSEIQERYYRGKSSNIIWCYFGYDEDDIRNNNYICRTTWVDENQDKNYWYKKTDKSLIVNEVYFNEINSLYYATKEFLTRSLTNKENREKSINIKKKCTATLISKVEKYISAFREFCNETITEKQLIGLLEPIIRTIEESFFEQSNLPITDLTDFDIATSNICGTIHTLSLFYNKRYLDLWTSDNRKKLTIDLIKQYQLELEDLKTKSTSV